MDTQGSASPKGRPNTNSQETIALNILSLLAKELPKLVENAPQNSTFSNGAHGESRKRRRIENEEEPWKFKPAELKGPAELPNDETLELIIAAYFSHVHHWIPMIHQGRYRQRMDNPSERNKLDILTHASKYILNPSFPSLSPMYLLSHEPLGFDNFKL